MSDKTKQVTFRLELTFFEQLEKEGGERGFSTNQYARELVVAGLMKTPAAGPGPGTPTANAGQLDLLGLMKVTEGQTTVLQAEARKFRQALAVMAQALLVKLADLSPEDAKRWVQAKMLEAKE
jgi:hypothetical protein